VTILYETHATSLDNEAQLASGWFDVALSGLGEQQARELGERRRGEMFAAIYCSDLRRAYDTAAIAFAGTDVPIVRDVRLRECDYGELTRHATAEIDARRRHALDTPFPGGESYTDATRRVGEWLREAIARHGDETVLVIGHRATFYALEHLCRNRTLADVLGSPWRWQAGWRYEARA
jgi:2,3-bisphosphoglycerate-dependent phosphoglycerate mutase